MIIGLTSYVVMLRMNNVKGGAKRNGIKGGVSLALL